jgi:hypothetical protein
VTDAEEALCLTNNQKFYMKTALDALASKYDEHQKNEDATQVRMLAQRVEAHETPKKQPTAEDAAPWQHKIIACGRNNEKVQGVMREWWHALAATAVDPAAALVDALMPMMDQTGQQMAVQILVTIKEKMKAVARDPSLPPEVPCSKCGTFNEKPGGAEMALEEIMRFVQEGETQAKSGHPLWTTDPHLQDVAQRIRQQQQQQQQH